MPWARVVVHHAGVWVGARIFAYSPERVKMFPGVGLGGAEER